MTDKKTNRLLIEVVVLDESMTDFLIEKLKVYGVNPKILHPPTDEEIIQWCKDAIPQTKLDEYYKELLAKLMIDDVKIGINKIFGEEDGK